MTENALLGVFLRRHLRPFAEPLGGLAFKHADPWAKGVPDVSLTLNGRTTWWEFKLAEPRVNMRGRALQRRNMKILARAGSAWYVIYQTGSSGQLYTIVTRPICLQDDGSFSADVVSEGWDHRFVLDFMKKGHGLLP